MLAKLDYFFINFLPALAATEVVPFDGSNITYDVGKNLDYVVLFQFGKIM